MSDEAEQNTPGPSPEKRKLRASLDKLRNRPPETNHQDTEPFSPLSVPPGVRKKQARINWLQDRVKKDHWTRDQVTLFLQQKGFGSKTDDYLSALGLLEHGKEQ